MSHPWIHFEWRPAFVLAVTEWCHLKKNRVSRVTVPSRWPAGRGGQACGVPASGKRGPGLHVLLPSCAWLSTGSISCVTRVGAGESPDAAGLSVAARPGPDRGRAVARGPHAAGGRGGTALRSAVHAAQRSPLSLEGTRTRLGTAVAAGFVTLIGTAVAAGFVALVSSISFQLFK